MGAFTTTVPSRSWQKNSGASSLHPCVLNADVVDSVDDGILQ
jgi:hypothetical protein